MTDGPQEYLVGRSLMIIDDDQALRDLLKTYFEVNNDVATFNKAEDCLEALKTEAASEIFIIDYFLPAMHGIDLFKILRPRYPRSKMVLMTGHLSPELAEEGLKLGFDSLLLKPFDFRILEQNLVDLFKK